mgnify:CR=1 FL=1
MSNGMEEPGNWPRSGVVGRGSRFSMADTVLPHERMVRVTIYTSAPVPSPLVSYGSVAMTCIDAGEHRAFTTEHNYVIINPPIGAQVLSGDFSQETHFEVRRLHDEQSSRFS